MAEIEDRCLVGDGITPEIETCELTHGLNVIECFFRAGVRERIPLLQKINPQHRAQSVEPTAIASLGIMRFSLESTDTACQRFLGRHYDTIRPLTSGGDNGHKARKSGVL